MPAGDAIAIELTVPSGQPGVRHYGQRVVIRIDRNLGVRVTEAVFGTREILTGGINLGSVIWDRLPECEADWEICRTGLEMIDARIETTIKLFARGYLVRDWLSPRAQWEI